MSSLSLGTVLALAILLSFSGVAHADVVTYVPNASGTMVSSSLVTSNQDAFFGYAFWILRGSIIAIAGYSLYRLLHGNG